MSTRGQLLQQKSKQQKHREGKEGKITRRPGNYILWCILLFYCCCIIERFYVRCRHLRSVAVGYKKKKEVSTSMLSSCILDGKHCFSDVFFMTLGG